MFRHRGFKVGVVLLSFLALSAGLAACRHNPEEKAEYLVYRITQELELSEQQVRLVDEIKDYALNAREEFGEHRRQKHEQFRAMLQSDAIDEAAVLSQLDAHHRDMTQRIRGILPKVTELHASLTPAQKEKILEFMERHSRHGGHGWGH